MSKHAVTKGATSQTFMVFIRDSSSTTGAGLTGLAYNTGSLVASYCRPAAARAAISLATQTTTGAWSSGGFVEIDSTNMPGCYRLDVPDAVFATGVNNAIVMLKGATNMEPCVLEFSLTGVDFQDAVHLGITGIPNAAAGASGGLLISGSNAGTTTLAALTITGALTGTGGIAANITGNITGNLSGSAGSVTGAVGSVTGNVGGNVSGSVGSVSAGVNVTQLNGQAVTAAAGVTFPSSIASPTNITAGTITTVTNLTNAPGAGDFTSTMKTSLATAVATELATTTYTEPGQGNPGVTVSLKDKIGYLYKAWRNQSTQDSGTYKLYADDATTVDQKVSVTDNGTVLTRGEVATGP